MTSNTDLILSSNRATRNGDFAAALHLLQTGLTQADDPELRNELGVVYFQMGDLANARQNFALATELHPGYARAWTNLGACYNDEGDNPNAIRCYRKAIALNPRMVDAWSNMGKAWNDSEEFEQAVYCYRQAMQLKPSSETRQGLAKAYRKGGRYSRAERLFHEALGDEPNNANCHFGLALTLFYLERYGEAIQEFEWRMRTREMLQHQQDLYPIFQKNAFKGEDLSTKTLLLHTEQGFGDCIQFARFIDLVRPKVKRLVMWCRPGLGRLFDHNFTLDGVSENVFNLPTFDVHLPLLSVPYFFDAELKTLDHFTTYLHANPDSQVSRCQGSGLQVGLVWGASDSGFDHTNKKVPLSLLGPLLDLPGIVWHSLQVGSDRCDLVDNPAKNCITDHGEGLGDFLDTANVIQHLDLIITCDTAVAHLAGSMGKPVWVMLKKEPDWRWGTDGETTPWYPSATIFRQQSHGCWDSVIRRLTAHLAVFNRPPNG